MLVHATDTSASPSSLAITDPMAARQAGLLGKLFSPMLRDQRDLPFVRLSLLLSLLLLPVFALMFWPGAFRWWLALLYWPAYLWFLGPYVLMLHNTTHRPLFTRPFGLLNHYIPWVLGPLLGVSPETYRAHHMSMHHVEGNGPDDLSSTLAYQRDSFADFSKYYLSFLFGHFGLSRYWARRGRTRQLRRFWTGELFYLALTALALSYDWRPALVVFVLPLLFTRFMLMAGNWAQHAFVDPDDPSNDYRTVVSFINSPYNHRCFNDGYHLGHHLKANRHWLEMPAAFLAQQPEMVRQQSIVFRKLDYFMIFVLLMLKQHRVLARYFVNLDPDTPLDQETIIALIKHRLRKLSPAQLEQIRGRQSHGAV